MDSLNNKIKLYVDVNYEDNQTGRVNGGYIFRSYDTDGGELVLQSKERSVSWSDTDIKITIPMVKDTEDYLIDTFATESSFFDNMDAVQQGFNSICLYSGSYIRGELCRDVSFWSLSTSPHRDQSLYIQSPYRRNGSKALFATAIYPFRYDSLGFPSVMGEVAKRLDSSSTYVWNQNNHYLIDVTFNGETRSYGGSGYGKGQGISQDKIKQYFTFGSSGTDISLESVKELLNEYAAIEMDDDVPREDALTWESVCDKVGSGSWVCLTKITGVLGSTSKGYTYLYKERDGKYHIYDVLDNGTELYWFGDLKFLSDAWIDGRYINAWESYVPGAKFEDHPTSNIVLKDVAIPQVKYEYRYNTDTGKYEYIINDISEKNQTVTFSYSTSGSVWNANATNVKFDDGCANYSTLLSLVEKGVLDEQYLDVFTLTLGEVNGMEVDKNTNVVPTEYYIYDGTATPGTYITESE